MDHRPGPDLQADEVTTLAGEGTTMGGHAGTPWFEVDDGARFFTRRLR